MAITAAIIGIASIRPIAMNMVTMTDCFASGCLAIDSIAFDATSASPFAAAREAKRKGRPIRLEPMTSWERRIVHISLKERDDVSTCSIGSEPLRRVVVSPIHKGNHGMA